MDLNIDDIMKTEFAEADLATKVVPSVVGIKSNNEMFTNQGVRSDVLLISPPSTLQ